MVSPFPLIQVSGSAGERGVQYGKAAADRIAESAALYNRALSKYELDSGSKAKHLDAFLGDIGSFDASYVEEMRGIAEGAGVDLFEIVLINARTEMLQLAASAKRVRLDPDGCTGLVALPAATQTGEVIHAQNWDWKAECAETGVVLRIARDDGPDILTFTEAGALARAGLNSAGLAITANYLECDRDYTQQGVPLPLIRRKVLEQEHYAMAIRAIACTPKSASNNMMLSTGHGMAIDIECAPDEAFFLHPEQDILVHANHWRSAVALSKLRETGIDGVPDSLYRDARVESALLSRRGRIRVADVKSALFDDWESPYSVCRPVMKEHDGGNLSATVAMIVMQPATGVIEIAPLPAENRAFTRYEIGSPDLTTTQASPQVSHLA